LLFNATQKIYAALPALRPLNVFIPPYNAWNADTKTALTQLGFTHMSSQLELDPAPYPFTGQTFYRFPEGAATDDEDLVNVLTYSVGVPAVKTMADVQKQITGCNFAVG
jgi:hypothetical protein